eukprot:5156137-Pleurochrysis_carterae.AAC.5
MIHAAPLHHTAMCECPWPHELTNAHNVNHAWSGWDSGHSEHNVRKHPVAGSSVFSWTRMRTGMRASSHSNARTQTQHNTSRTSTTPQHRATSRRSLTSSQ